MLQILGFAIGLGVALWIGFLVLSLIGRCLGLGEEIQDRFAREDDLKAIRADPGAFKLNTPNGVVFLAPSGWLYKPEDVFPVSVDRAERASELRP